MEVIFDLPAQEYHAREACSASLLQRLEDASPFEAKFSEFETTPAMLKGTVAHLNFLEPCAFNSDVIRVDCSTRATNIYKEVVSINPSKICLPKAEYDEILAMRPALQKSNTAQSFLKHSVGNEVSVFWESCEWTDGDGLCHRLESSIKCKARIDLLSIFEKENIGVVVDYKTTNNPSPKAFKRNCHSLGYHRKACWYLEAMRLYRPDLDWRFVWIAQGSKAPYSVTCHEVDSSWLDLAANQLLKPVKIYEECIRLNDWPNYSDEIFIAHPENWMLREDN